MSYCIQIVLLQGGTIQHRCDKAIRIPRRSASIPLLALLARPEGWWLDQRRDIREDVNLLKISAPFLQTGKRHAGHQRLFFPCCHFVQVTRSPRPFGTRESKDCPGPQTVPQLPQRPTIHGSRGPGGTLDDFFSVLLGEGFRQGNRTKPGRSGKRDYNVAVSGGSHGRVERSEVRGNRSHRRSDTW